MSGNQKPTAAGGQQMRYSTSPYQPIQPQLQQPRDSFHVTTQSYVPQQQPNQAGSQGTGLRGIPQSGPPNQAPTPPNTDLKVQSVPQQAPMNPMYAAPSTVPVRSTQNYYRAQGPPNPTPRMPNQQHRAQQQMYQAPQTGQYLQMSVPSVYIATNPLQYYGPGQRPQNYVQQAVPMYHGQHITPSYPTFSPATQTPTTVTYPYYQLQRTGPPPPQATSTPSNQTQNALPSMPSMTQPVPPQQPFQRQQKRRPNALPIIDPTTGVDKLNEIFEQQQDSSHPPSGESSARQTPQPAPHNASKEEVQATFRQQVTQVLNKDDLPLEDHSITEDLAEHPMYHHPQSHPAVPPIARLDQIVQSSNLKVAAKEFILPTTAKETPIVSANCDAVEVTLTSKLIDRESPAKQRKPKHVKKDVVGKEAPQVEKPCSIIKEEVKPKEEVVTNVVPVVPIPSHKYVEEEKDVECEIQIESKVPSVETSECIASIRDADQPEEDATAATVAKSKQNASQKSKEVQKPVSQVNQKTNPVVPTPQPAKPNNKSSKKSELNNKGANKEGTDMDAFNDNVNSNVDADAVNANVVVNTNNDIINANSLPITNNAPPATTNIVDTNKQIESNEPLTIKPEIKPTPKTKVDVTNIFGGKANMVSKPFVAPVESNRDEIDRVSFATEKLVQAKNEVNVKVSSENSDTNNVIEPKSELPYKEGHWNPTNLDGKKVYDKDLLLAIRNRPSSKIKPTNLLESVMFDDRPRLCDNRFSTGGRTDFINPPFQSNYVGKSSSQRGSSVTKRGSQSGKINSNKGSKSNNGGNKISISLREEIKLHESENAWKPTRYNKAEVVVVEEEDSKTAELYKKVRGVLNKLTPQKFETLVGQVRNLQIDTVHRLQGVIDLVFEKAVDEPNFSVAYANMCRELALLQVPMPNSTEENKEFVNFRKLLINRCQIEFEKQSKDESERNDKIKVIEVCDDAEKRKELEVELSEYDRRLRMKSVGNIRFIGELFKFQMLTANIMVKCVENLLSTKEEESLECLCKLLSTIGKELEIAKKADLTKYFNIMKDIVDRKHGKISSRIKFMLQDVIDLRRNKWIPRRQDLNPKTIDQIQKEAEHEQLNIQVMNSVPNTPRRDERGASGSALNSKRKNVSEDGWIVPQRNNRSTPFTVQIDKFKNKPPLIDEPLGSSHMFGNWGRGSNIKTPVNANKYAALDNIDSDKKMPINSRGSKDPYSSKGTSLERSSYKQQLNFDGHGSRSGSQQRSYDSSNSSSQRSTPAPIAAPPKPAPPVEPQLSEEFLDRHVRNCIDEYISDNCTLDEVDLDINNTVPLAYMPRVIADSYLHVLEKFTTTREKTGSLFAKLIKIGTIPLDEHAIGLEEVLAQAEDLTIDIPKFWDYLPDIMAPLICEEAVPLNRLHKSFAILISQGLAAKLLAPLFQVVVSKKGPEFLRSLWQISGLSISDFMPAEQVDQFISDNGFGFLLEGVHPTGKTELSYDQIEKKLSEFFASPTAFDDIVKWITTNVGERVKENKFIRTLATAICKNSIIRTKLAKDVLKGHYKLLQKYVDNNQVYELQCLYTIQSLVNQMEHPQGLLLAFFDCLYEDSIFPQESFIAWESSNDAAEQEGKGVAIKQLTSFFTQLKENDEEEEYASTGSEEA